MKSNTTFLRLLFGGLSIIGYRPNVDEASFIATGESFTTIDQILWMADKFPKSEHCAPTLRRFGSRELLLHCRRINIKLKDDHGRTELRIDCLETASSSKHCASITLTFDEKGTFTGNDNLANFAADSSRGNLHFELAELRNWLEPFGVVIPEPAEETVVSGTLVTALA